MPLEIMDRNFDPYFTTKGVGKGTGMCLAVVMGIVHDNGGAVIIRIPHGSLVLLTESFS